jgi:hypothetical protein
LEVTFLGFITNLDGIALESNRISTIEDTLTAKSMCDVEVLLGFTNIYRRFNQRNGMMTLPLTELLKRTEITLETRPKSALKAERKLTTNWEWTREVELDFEKLKKSFTGSPLLQHFDSAKPTILKSDSSSFSIAGILNQYDSFRILRPVNFHSRKCTPAVQNDDTYKQELLAIVVTMIPWRHFQERANYKILLQCDHTNLKYFQTSKVLSRRQACWAEIISLYDFVRKHLEGHKNLADGLSRRPDYEKGYERPSTRLLATLAAGTVEPDDNLLLAVMTTHVSDS